MPATGITFDTGAFRKGLRAKLAVTKKTEEQIINQAAGSVCANAIRLTKGAKKNEIIGDLTSNGLVFKLLQSPRFQARMPGYLKGFTRGTHTRAQINDAARVFVAQRARTIRYIAAGWFKALAVFRPASKRKVSDKGLAGKGTARKATERILEAVFVNFSRGAGEVGARPLQQALDEEGRSMQSYAEKKLANAWK